jgi:sortase A
MSTGLLSRPPELNARPGAHRSGGRGSPNVAAPRQRAPHEFPGSALVARSALVWFSLLMVWLVIYALALSGFQEQRSQHNLYAKLRVELAGETAPVGGAIPTGTPVALLDAPRGGVHDAVVVEGTSSKDLQKGPGHLSDTSLPGQAGVSAILGKGVTFDAPFANITKLSPGDPITVTTGQGVAHYVVSDVRRSGDPLPGRLAAGQGRLTLVAALGNGWRSGWAPTGIVYVDATLQGTALAAPSGRPTQVAPGESPMASNPGALDALVLWLQLLVVVVIVVTWARVRWGGWQVWLVGAPVVLAVAWTVTETSAQLLPNLL